MTGCQAIEPVRAGMVQEELEFDKVIAGDAGVRSAAHPVFRDKAVHNMAGKFLLSVYDAVWNSQVSADSLRGGYVAADAGSQLHGHAFHDHPLLFQQRRGDRAVHSAAHGNENAVLHAGILPQNEDGVISYDGQADLKPQMNICGKLSDYYALFHFRASTVNEPSMNRMPPASAQSAPGSLTTRRYAAGPLSKLSVLR